ncbi:sensor histidine kinase [Streptomyces sp. 4N509B]|uniref:sensor histidine kinase n=1 Tax=Streptomyces sp. 4N509B TaxID=3457413 RepID=UPI003FD0D4B9
MAARPAFRAGIRRRLVWVTVAVTAVALLLGTSGGVFVLHQVLLDSIKDTLTDAIEEIEDGQAASHPHASAGQARMPWNAHLDVAVAQLVDSDGRLVAGSRPDAPVAGLAPPPGQTATTQTGGMLVLAERVEVDGEEHTLVVGEPLRPVHVAVATVLVMAAVTVPLTVVLMGLLARRLTGRALAPVERIREQVAAIGEGDLGRRVPEPGGDDEITRLAATMNAMLTRLESAQRAQRRFVADAGHELRSPLTTLTGVLEIAERDGGRIDPDALRTAQGDARRLGDLITDLLLLARSDEGGLALRHEEVDLDDVVDGERARLRATTGVTVEASLTPVKVRGDREALVRLVRNLADNAARHARTRVRLATAEEDGQAVVDVADDGPGVPVGERERVFDRFVRLDDARGRRSGGAGLGLAIARQIAREHGGSVEVTDAPAGGALFRVRIPRPS